MQRAGVSNLRAEKKAIKIEILHSAEEFSFSEPFRD